MEYSSKGYSICSRLVRLILMLLVARGAFSMRSVARVDSQDAIVYLDRFGYLSDGTAKITFSTTSDSAPPNAWIIGCTSAQLALLEASPSGIKSICQQPDVVACDLKLNLKTTAEPLDATPISELSLFSDSINNGPSKPHFLVQVEMVFLNPNGEHLDSWNIPLVTIQPVFLALSLVGLILFFVNFVVCPRQSAHLYKLLWATLLADVAFYAATVAYWRILSSNGLREVYLLALLHGTHAIAQVLLFSLILAVGFGFGIVNPRLTPVQYSSVILGVAIAVSFSVGNLVNLYGLFMSVPFAIVIMFIFAKSVNHNIRFLESGSKSSDSSERVDLVLSFFTKARVGLVVYLLFFIATVVVAAAALSELRWVYRLVLQSLNIVLLWSLAFGLRLKRAEESIYLDSAKAEDSSQNRDRERGLTSSASQSAAAFDGSESLRTVALKEKAMQSISDSKVAASVSVGGSDAISASFDDMESLNDSLTPSSGPSTSDAEDF